MSKDKNKAASPMMLQYLEIKKQYPDTILLYRMGDFYEMFYEDATKASSVLGIVLTKRGNIQGDDIPMCGIPYHSYESYLNRLINNNYKVAICEQLESPEEAKKRGPKSVVKREVVRVITPGTILDDNLLEQNENNFLVAIVTNKNMAAISWVDISTGDFYTKELALEDINGLLYSIPSKEILISSAFNKSLISVDFHKYLNILPSEKYNLLSSKKILEEVFKDNNYIFNELSALEYISCGILVDYIDLTQKTVANLACPKKENDFQNLRLDFFTQRSLEIHQNYSNNKKGTLKSAIDRTCTSMGSRCLTNWLTHPIVDHVKINNRLEAVEFFFKQPDLLKKIRDLLKQVPDVERAISRICLNRGSVLDLSIVRQFLLILLEVRTTLFFTEIPYLLTDIIQSCDSQSTLLTELQQALIEEISIEHKDSNFVKTSYRSDLSHLLFQKNEFMREIKVLESSYKIKTQASALKIQYTSLAGYFIEVPMKQADLLKANPIFLQKQTLTNTIRYTTDEIIKIELQINEATARINQYEQEVLKKLLDLTIQQQNKLYTAAKNIGFLDVIVSFAFLANECNLVKPKISNDDKVLNILEGRHLVVEASLKNQYKDFIPNSCTMNEKSLFLITGPNMSGKSTFLRQNAIIVLLAHIGCFVPATSAEIGICDAIYSRVGASDDLFKGQSTFMVEMLELASILNNATDKSFIILDEVGRGTATYDGLSLAWATTEYIHNKLKSRTIFATHYHELTELEGKLPSLECYYVSLVEHKNEIIFMHQVKKGISGKSYGIEVAKLAGVAKEIVGRAKEILLTLEKNRTIIDNSLPLFDFNRNMDDNEEKEPFLEEHGVLLELKGLEVDNLSPKEALNFLYTLKSKL